MKATSTIHVFPVLAFIRLGRPLFLLGGFVFHGLGVAMALYDGAPFNPQAFVWGQLAVTSIQLMTHYANEYFDLEADRANPIRTRWAGGSRILADGHLPPAVALYTALTLGTVALGAALVLTFIVRPAILTGVLLALSLLLAWFYSAPPLRFHSRGLGEAVVALVVPVLTPLLGYYLQTDVITLLPLLATMPLAEFQFAMLLLIELPDAEGDRVANKRTLVVRLGERQAIRLHHLALLVAYSSLPLLVGGGLPVEIALVILAGLPLAGWQVWRLSREKRQDAALWDSLAFASIVLLLGSAGVETLVFLGLAGLAPG
jgi:1,4-dihydroxy-2-naphthoate octaprenyltransferase